MSELTDQETLNNDTHEEDFDDHTHDPEDGVHDHPEDADPTLFDPALYASADGLAGTTGPNGKPIWSAQQAADHLFRAQAGYGTTGNMVMPTSGTITQLNYGFHTSQASLYANGYVYETGGNLYGLSEYFNFKPFTEAQKAAAREAIQYWDDVVSTHFVETNINDADIAFGNYTNQPGTQAYARLLANTITSDPHINAQIRDIGGDVWVNFNTQSNFQLDEGGYGMNTLVHEVGHGFGMLHPGDYNFVVGGPALSYTSHAEYYQDTRAYSVLSYWNPREIGARDFDWTRMNIAYGATPMVHDILAMQTTYGADMTTRTGDTTYGFNSNAGRDAFDFTLTPQPTMTIWDAAGNDTLDASGYGTNQLIDLTPGSLSSIGGITAAEFPTFAQVNANRAAANMPAIAQSTYDANKAAFFSNPTLYGRLTDNVGIAYGAIIENAVGGSGHDTIIGNGADNHLIGNAGNDLMLGGIGNDTLDGGTGNDEMLGGVGDDIFIVGEYGDVVTELAGEGTDTVKASIDYTLGDNVENLTLTGSAVSGTGNGLDNVLTGNDGANLLKGMDGNDTLIGAGGNDTLDGGHGNDAMIGGTGDDRYVVDAAGDTVTELAGEGNDTVESSIDYVLGANVENLELTGGAVSGTGNGLDNFIFGNGLNNSLWGGDGNDTLFGGAGSDRLSGGNGNDRLVGGDGTDFMTGGAGNDVFVAEIGTTKVATKYGQISLDVITDFQAGDVIDVSAFAGMHFNGSAANKGMGDLTIKSFGNMNAAEAALGVDLDGIDGPSTYTGKVTVVFGDVDGGGVDFAIALFGVSGVTTNDFHFV